jgi:hypothetical protein
LECDSADQHDLKLALSKNSHASAKNEDCPQWNSHISSGNQRNDLTCRRDRTLLLLEGSTRQLWQQVMSPSHGTSLMWISVDPKILPLRALIMSIESRDILTVVILFCRYIRKQQRPNSKPEGGSMMMLHFIPFTTWCYRC